MLDSVNLMFIATVVGPQMMYPYSSIGQTSVLYSIGTVCSSKFSKLCLMMPSILKPLFTMSAVCKWNLSLLSSFSSLRVGSQVFALLILFLCVILHTMSLGKTKSLQLLCIFPFCMLCLSALSMTMFEI